MQSFTIISVFLSLILPVVLSSENEKYNFPHLPSKCETSKVINKHVLTPIGYYQTDRTNNLKRYFIPTYARMSWQKAEKYCAKSGLKLATLESQREINYILKVLEKYKSRIHENVYLGDKSAISLRPNGTLEFNRILPDPLRHDLFICESVCISPLMKETVWENFKIKNM